MEKSATSASAATRVLLCCLFAIALDASGAQPMKPEEVPAPLKPWIPWALHGTAESPCPLMAGKPDERACAWPGLLELDMHATGGKFRQAIRVYGPPAAPLWVAVPGGAGRWPQNVTSNGKVEAVIGRDGVPGVYLAPGEHRLAGQFAWSALPENFLVPRNTGLIALTLNGRKAEEVRWDATGLVTLSTGDGAKTAERVELRVARLLADEIPALLTTRLTLSVSGKSREIRLASLLPQDALPMSLASTLPARLDRDKRLIVQVRPGEWEVTLVARLPQPVKLIAAPKIEGVGEEIWAFAARPALRQVTPGGAPQIDPQQTMLPQDWRRYPAFRLKPGDALALTETRRGDPEPNPDQLTLARQMWLDFDGGGYTVKDEIGGSLSRSWRLSLAAPYALGRAALGGREQLITRGAGDAPGLEVRVGQAEVTAESRLESGARQLPAVGWSFDPQRLGTVLHLPPGWRLLGAGGVDRAQGAWVSQWNLLDFFLVLVASVAAFRLWSWRWGLATLALLVITWQEDGAPGWLWLNLIAAAALIRALGETRLGPWLKRYRNLSWLAVVVVALPFAVDQVRSTLYPALDLPRQYADTKGYSFNADVTGAQRARDLPALAEPPAAHQESFAPAQRAAPSDRLSSLSKSKATRMDEIDPKAVVQTGPGLPSWTWHSYQLTWNGPVEKTQTINLWLLAPWAKAILVVLQLGLIAALLVRVFESVPLLSTAWRRWTGTAAIALLAAGSAFFLDDARAAESSFPDAALLEELKARLTPLRPDCRPNCATLPRLRVENAGGELRLRLEVHAAELTGVPLPGGARQWTPSQALLDGKPASALRDAADQLWLVVPAGIHQVILSGALPRRDTVQIALPLKPKRVEAQLSGWRLDGVDADGGAESALQLSRLASTKTGKESAAAGASEGNIAPFTRIERSFALGLEWRITTRVTRVNLQGQPVVLEYPLLPGESVITPEVKAENGKARVVLAPQAGEALFESTLKIAPTLKLAAAAQSDWVETWKLDGGSQWHFELAGIPVVHRQSEGRHLPQWQPWPGEEVTIAVTRPEAVPGPWLTLEQATLKATPGDRVTEARLTLGLRASRGGEHSIGLPEEVALQSATVNGRSEPLKLENGKLTFPVVPGAQQVDLLLRLARGMELRYSTPAIKLNLPGVNQRIQFELPRERWLLWFAGPRLGPAILLWGIALVLALVGYALGRVSATPLRPWQWILLLLGLTQTSILGGLVIVGWLFALAARERFGAQLAARRSFNAMQIGIALLTLAALVFLIAAVKSTLLGAPHMNVVGNGSSELDLNWYQDRGDFPTVTLISLPLLAWRGVTLAWALWLAWSVIAWLRWGWQAFNVGGLWQKRETPRPPAEPRAEGSASPTQ